MPHWLGPQVPMSVALILIYCCPTMIDSSQALEILMIILIERGTLVRLGRLKLLHHQNHLGLDNHRGSWGKRVDKRWWHTGCALLPGTEGKGSSDSATGGSEGTV